MSPLTLGIVANPSAETLAIPEFTGTLPTVSLTLQGKLTNLLITSWGSWSNSPTSYEAKIDLWMGSHGSGSYNSITMNWTVNGATVEPGYSLGNLDDSARHHALQIRATNASGTSAVWEGHLNTQARSNTFLTGITT
jgi:hypothetical protein